MGNDTFDVLILIGRPASGKSEIIDFLKHTAPDIRRSRYHIAELEVIDDFPMLWTWFEEDRILSQRLGQPRLYTDEGGYFKPPSYWHLLTERLSLDYQKRRRDDPAYHDHTTALVEFSRGIEHGGLRKNRRRYNPQRPDSILEHGLSDEKMERLYRADDWGSLAQGESGFITVRAVHVPYAVFENEDDVTTDKPDLLAARLEIVLDKLWKLRQR